MNIQNIRTLDGPNIYHHKPVLVMQLDLEELAGKQSTDFPEFIERLRFLLPGLDGHYCASGKPGGFIDRFHEGTYFGHIVEHVALELSQRAGIGADYGKTLATGTPRVYQVVVRYRAEQAMRYVLRVAVELVGGLLREEQIAIDRFIGEAIRIAAVTELGPSTQAIIRAAGERDIPWQRLDDASMVQLGQGKYRRLVEAAISDRTGAIGVDIACNKELTRTLLRRAAIPVPRGCDVRSEEEAIAAFEELGPPVVVKPADGHQGQGVSLNLRTRGDVLHAYRIACEYSGKVLVEELLRGRDYRLLIVNGALVAASERFPAHVAGDGIHTIGELIEKENCDPRRGEGHEKQLTKISIDSVVLAYLAKFNRSFEDIPRRGEQVFLRESANLSTGGTARDCTAQVHPETRRLCERAARTIGLDICGIDLVADDISRPLGKNEGIVELNAAPGLRMHLYPNEGQKQEVGRAIVDMLYPPGAPARVPIISVTGTNGKTTITRLIGHVIQAAGTRVGMTTTDGIFVGGECIESGDTTGPDSARTILFDPTVEAAVLETARGGIVRCGLGYDWADIGIISNIQPDHIGQDGIESIDDLVHIKSLVAERVREGGTLILNADDEHSCLLASREGVRAAEKNVIYFSFYPNHPLLRRHLEAGGTVYFLRGRWVVEAIGRTERPIVDATTVPVTLSGLAVFNVANIMAAVAACRAYGLEREQIAAALESFDGTLHNPGRANLYKVLDGYVMVDYGHNPSAFRAICSMLANHSPGRKRTAVLGVPGDRANWIIEEAGQAAAHGFHSIIIREDEDLRGRRAGETAGLLYHAIKKEAPGQRCSIIPEIGKALLSAIQRMDTGELIIVFYDRLDPVRDILSYYDAIPVRSLEDFAPRQRRAADAALQERGVHLQLSRGAS